MKELKNILMTTRRCLPTAERLQPKLSKRLDAEVSMCTDIRAASSIALGNYVRVFNWGFSGDASPLNFGRWVGCPNHVKKCSNKLIARAIIAPVALPGGSTYPGDTLPKLSNYPIYLRKRFHRKGRGLMVVTSPGEFDRMRGKFAYWTAAITQPRLEYRIHVGGDGELIHRQVKSWRALGKEPAPGSLQDVVRNHDNGWQLNSIARVHNSVALAARKAIELLGVPWGAVDVIRLRSDNTAYVLEINSAPGLSNESALNAWADYLILRAADRDLQGSDLSNLKYQYPPAVKDYTTTLVAARTGRRPPTGMPVFRPTFTTNVEQVYAVIGEPEQHNPEDEL